MTNNVYGFAALLFPAALWGAAALTGTLVIFTAIGGALSTGLEAFVAARPVLP